MATCGICARETCDTPLSRDSNVKYSKGDVYSVRDSIYIPINEILMKTFGAGTPAFNRSSKSLKELTRHPDVIRYGRPAVITKDQDDDRQGVWVCLATTYSGEEFSKLPRIFQHFSIPIAPNMGHGLFGHLHGLPEWERKNAYLIGWPFQSKATREGIWTVRIDDEEVPQVLGKEAMEFLIAECERKAEEWWEMCEDREVAAALGAELREHVRKRFGSGNGSKTSSRESVATGVDAPWWRKPTTIFEESENDFVLVTSGKQRGPMPWKSTGKHRAGSTSSFGSASTKKGDADKNSIKSTRSRTSLAQKQNGTNRFNFDLLRAVRVNAG